MWRNPCFVLNDDERSPIFTNERFINIPWCYFLPKIFGIPLLLLHVTIEGRPHSFARELRGDGLKITWAFFIWKCRNMFLTRKSFYEHQTDPNMSINSQTQKPQTQIHKTQIPKTRTPQTRTPQTRTPKTRTHWLSILNRHRTLTLVGLSYH